MNKRSRGHAKRGPPEVRSRARLREAAVLLPTRAGDGRDCCLFLPPNFLDSSAPTLIRDARRELQSNRTITSHIHHPFERSRTPPAPNVATFFRAFPRSSRARRRRSFLRVFLVYNDERRARGARSSLPSPGRSALIRRRPFLSPRRRTSKMTARLLAASPSSASALAHRRRGLGSRRAFFFFLFCFHLGLFPAGVSASSSESPGSRPPSYQHRSLSCDSIFEKSNPPRLHFSGSSILRSRK